MRQFNTNVTASPSGVHITIAVKIARRFPKRAPTVQELVSMFGMHRSTAYRWRAAFLDAGSEE